MFSILIDNAIKYTKPGGYGLGLAIAKDIIEQHGGTIQVKSTLGEGTEFTVIFK